MRKLRRTERLDRRNRVMRFAGGLVGAVAASIFLSGAAAAVPARDAATQFASLGPAARAPDVAARPGRAPVPVLGNAFAGSHGFGHAHPRLLASGPGPTVTVQHLHWRRWGTKRAVGLGKGWYVPDNAQAVSDGKVATEKVVAFHLGRCRGKRAYLKYIWYFPAYRKAPSPRDANSACI